MIASLTERAERGGPIAEPLESVLSESGYIEALEAERSVEAEGRIENLQELVGMASEFDVNRELEGESEVTPLEEFLEQISLINEQDALVDDGSKVTLMTLHNAKGLEYDVVFIIGCEDGVFPHSRSVDEGNLEEERRLCYVGMTRARKLLTLTYARRRMLFGQGGNGIPSRFLGEIPSDLVERHRPRRRWAGARAAQVQVHFGSSPLGGGSNAGFVAVPDKHPALELTVGDDVIHASFGEGVVTAVEPGNVVVIRFRTAVPTASSWLITPRSRRLPPRWRRT